MIFAILAFGGAVTGDRPSHEVARLAAMSASGPLPDGDPWIMVNLASAGLSIAGRDAEALHLLDRGIGRRDAAGMSHHSATWR